MIIDMDASDTAHVSFYQNGGSNTIDLNADATYFGGHLVC